MVTQSHGPFDVVFHNDGDSNGWETLIVSDTDGAGRGWNFGDESGQRLSEAPLVFRSRRLSACNAQAGRSRSPKSWPKNLTHLQQLPVFKDSSLGWNA